jgi:hypothetical protein
MKLKYLGGNTEEVQVVIDPKVPHKTKAEKRDQLSQTFEQVEYHWPKPGSVLSVPSHIGSWLLGKCRYTKGDAKGQPMLVEVAEEKPQTQNAPRRVVAVTEDDGKGDKTAKS